VAYDLELADRLREILAAEPRVTEKRMFGGLAFLVQGRLAVSASSQGGLLLRVDPGQTEALLAHPQVSPFVMRGRQMSGWVRVEVDGSTTDDELDRWVQYGLDYAESLPPL
jgi:TfoX/Sxy family transcriptional regulator of competence genes